MAQEAELVPQPHGGALRRGNPGPRETVKKRIQKTFQEALEKPDKSGGISVAQAIVRDALAGEPTAQRIVVEYAIGKPETRVEVTGEGGGPVLLSPVLAELSDDELQDRIKKLEE